MIKNIFLLIVILVAGYMVIVFQSPQLASNIEKTIGIEWIGNQIREFKNTTDSIVTDVPSREEFEKAYEEIYTWALEWKETIQDWAEKTKDAIDTVRETVSWAQDTYNEIKEGIDDAVEFIDSNSWKIKEAKELIQWVSDLTTVQSTTQTWEVLTQTGETDIQTWTLNE